MSVRVVVSDSDSNDMVKMAIMTMLTVWPTVAADAYVVFALV